MQNLDTLIEEAEKDWPKLQVRLSSGWRGVRSGWLTPIHLYNTTYKQQARLERIRAMVVKKENLILNLTGDRQTLGDVLVRLSFV